MLAAHIAAGSLPRGLHALDLSRNNIGSIEGLRELTRLRVLSLSYNRISRIGHGKPPTHFLPRQPNISSVNFAFMWYPFW
jgi:Leucine-rich repeat (LRR) protein